MRHTVKIIDSKDRYIKLSVAVDNFGKGGSWQSMDKGGIRYVSGPVKQFKPFIVGTDWDVFLFADGYWGIKLSTFLTHCTANYDGTGWLFQRWVLGLTPGAIYWQMDH